MRILLHICCAPCSIMPIESLRASGHEIVGLYTNPNIHPVAEYARRRDQMAQYAQDQDVKLIIKDEDYDLQSWFREVSFREANRCFHCYRIRLERTLSIAKRGNFDAFTTTLLYSKRQKHETIADLGKDLAGGGAVKFLYQDFRTGWAEGIERSKKLNQYRQDYCGCLYSDLERRRTLLNKE